MEYFWLPVVMARVTHSVPLLENFSRNSQQDRGVRYGVIN